MAWVLNDYYSNRSIFSQLRPILPMNTKITFDLLMKLFLRFSLEKLYAKKPHFLFFNDIKFRIIFQKVAIGIGLVWWAGKGSRKQSRRDWIWDQSVSWWAVVHFLTKLETFIFLLYYGLWCYISSSKKSICCLYCKYIQSVYTQNKRNNSIHP